MGASLHLQAEGKAGGQLMLPHALPSLAGHAPSPQATLPAIADLSKFALAAPLHLTSPKPSPPPPFPAGNGTLPAMQARAGSLKPLSASSSTAPLPPPPSSGTLAAVRALATSPVLLHSSRQTLSQTSHPLPRRQWDSNSNAGSGRFAQPPEELSQFFIHLALCNTVVPGTAEDGTLQYQVRGTSGLSRHPEVPGKRRRSF